MGGQTIAQKILSSHSGARAEVGEIVVCDIDLVMGHDANGPMAIRAFEKMGGTRVTNPEKVVFVMDHMGPAPFEKAANLQAVCRNFAAEQGTQFMTIGEGVSHQIMAERGMARPGGLVLGSDSHTCTLGAFGAFATGVGATDLAACLLTGRNWFRVPETVKITFEGKLDPGCSTKDVILYVVGRVGADGGNYKSFEFYGDWLEDIGTADHMTLANMLVEMGCKCGFVCHSNLGIEADPDAVYAEETVIDLTRIEPGLAKPHTVDNYAPISELVGMKVDQGFLGSCTNGRIEDIRIVAAMLAGRKIHEDVRFIVTPASKAVHIQAMAEGHIATLMEAGAVFFTPGCGGCVGTHGGVPADGEVVISSANRNFRGRMGNSKASIYLASPASVAAAMLTGVVTDPRMLAEQEGAHV